MQRFLKRKRELRKEKGGRVLTLSQSLFALEDGNLDRLDRDRLIAHQILRHGAEARSGLRLAAAAAEGHSAHND